MNKNVRCFFLIIVIALIMMGCKKQDILANDTLIDDDFNGLDLEKINHYDIEVRLDYEDKIYTCKQEILYVNNTDRVLGELYFHLYPNAFKTVDRAPILFSNTPGAEKSYKGGYMNIESVSRDDKDLEYTIQGEDETILYIKLNEPLLKGQKTTIHMEYEVVIPTAKDRFGYGNRVINAGNWYPIACVYDEDGWNLEPYYRLGDPFYSDVSNYNVSIYTDRDVVIASSGNILSEDIEDNKKIYKIEGKLIRDFAWAASKDFKIAEGKVDDTLIKLYYLDRVDSMVEKSIKIGEDSIEIFNRVFGKYPYGVYSIVMTEFPSGMEYPGIVFIGEEYFRNSLKDMLEQVIVHETAHQWWYGLVGNDEVREAWLDEALTTYSEVIYHKELYGLRRGEGYFIENIKLGYEYGEGYLTGDRVVNKPLGDFVGWNDYGILVYTKGAMFIDDIKTIYGEDILYKIFRTYFNRYRFYNARTEDFIKVCEEVTNTDFGDLVQRWLY
ncbi:MAG: M1 family metallopeptidase [Tissierellaceae bacterium]